MRSHRIQIRRFLRRRLTMKNPKRAETFSRIATPNAVVKRLKFGDTGVTCCLDHLGEDGPECMTEETIIYINRDHPLYKRESKKRRRIY